MDNLKLFLFDLDGTLVSTGGAGLRALSRTFFELFDIPDVLTSLDPSGKTDPAIFREIVQKKYLRDITTEELKSITQRYLSYLKIEMEDHSKVKILPGVFRFLQELENRKDILAGLGTGNLEKGARCKLGPTNLNPFFAFGGFGSDAEERCEMLQVGHRRGEEIAGKKIDKGSVYIIGDTILDIGAAKKSGYKSVGVASGSTPLGILKQANPDFAIQNMDDGSLFLEAIEKVSVVGRES